MGERLLIVGASGRAAAASAIRAGFEPVVIDLFADADTKRLCPVLKCDPNDYPHGFVELAKQAPPGPWMYTGGLENHPDVVAGISEHRPLWGNPPEVLGQFRDPFRLSDLLCGKALSHPQPLPAGSTLPADGVWLRKPLRSSGGTGICFVNPSDRGGENGAHFFQRHISGHSMSLLFATFAPGYKVLGYTFQLVGTCWLHARPFHYAGSIGSVPTTGLDMQDVHLSAFRFGDRTSLRGLGNIDFIHDGEQSHVIEVNPRYPASAEVIEFATGVRTLDWHRKGFFRHLEPPPPSQPTHIVGKGVYYAAKSIPFPVSGPWDESLARCTDVWRRPDYADIPEPGTVIVPGQPVLTVFAEAATEEECIEQLKRRAAGLDQLFGVPTPPEGEP